MSYNFAFHFDATGRPRVASSSKEPLPPAVVQFLESDLAMDTAYINRILAGEKEVRTDKPWQISGNAFGIAMTKDETTLTPLIETKAVEPVTLATRDFLTLVGMWKAFLAGPKKKRSPEARG